MFCVGDADNEAKELIRTVYNAWQVGVHADSIYASCNREKLGVVVGGLAGYCLPPSPMSTHYDLTMKIIELLSLDTMGRIILPPHPTLL